MKFDDTTRQELIAFLKKNLTLDIEQKSEYCSSDADAGNLHRYHNTITINLCGEEISSVQFNSTE